MSDFEFWESGDGDCTTTCEFGLIDLVDELVFVSTSDSCGEIKRAVRGVVVEREGPFLRIGGKATGAFDVVEEDVVLGRLWTGRWGVVALAAPGPWQVGLF